jgi:general secretion pathway protein C
MRFPASVGTLKGRRIIRPSIIASSVMWTKLFFGIIAGMWRRWKTTFNWRPHAPRLTTIALAFLMTIDAAHTVWALHGIVRAQVPPRPLALQPRELAFDTPSILQAHLFGETVVAVAQVDPANAPDTQLALTLSGVLATDNPNAGYAILGAADKPAHMYRIGADLQDVSGGRLRQVFVDRVVLELDGKLQTLRLPRRGLPGSLADQSTVAAASATASTAPPGGDQGPAVPTPAQGWFANLNVEQNSVDGQAAGMVMHPGKRFQREYGFKDSDILTAVNGVEITDADALAGTLKTNANSLSLTFVRDGIPRTVKLPVSY